MPVERGNPNVFKVFKELTITLAKIDTTLDGVASAIKEMKEEKGN